MRRGELARATGCHPESIRYYERIGLLREPPRSHGNQRIYDRSDLARASFIAGARAVGISIENIRELLSMMDDGTVTCSKVRSRAVAHRDALRREIGDLSRVVAQLDQVIGRCDGNESPSCPIVHDLAKGIR